jgi:hypothetical protein
MYVTRDDLQPSPLASMRTIHTDNLMICITPGRVLITEIPEADLAENDSWTRDESQSSQQ